MFSLVYSVISTKAVQLFFKHIYSFIIELPKDVYKLLLILLCL